MYAIWFSDSSLSNFVTYLCCGLTMLVLLSPLNASANQCFLNIAFIDYINIFGLFFGFNNFIIYPKRIIALVMKYWPNMFYFLFRNLSNEHISKALVTMVLSVPHTRFLIKMSFSSDRDWYGFFLYTAVSKNCCFEIVKHLKMGFFHLFVSATFTGVQTLELPWFCHRRENVLLILVSKVRQTYQQNGRKLRAEAIFCKHFDMASKLMRYKNARVVFNFLLPFTRSWAAANIECSQFCV